MSRYVLDTTVLIECQLDVEPTASRVTDLVRGRHELFVCAVELAEYHTGAPRGANARMDRFLDTLTLVELTREMAATAGRMRHDASSQGRRLTTPDALIAALAAHLDATLLTNNVSDFALTGIAVERLGGAMRG